MQQKLRAGVIGATGMVGQRFLTLLADHPYFQVTALCASASSAGKAYGRAVEGRWKMKEQIPAQFVDMPVMDAADIAAVKPLVDFVFCAVDMPKDQTRALEEAYAKAEIPVVSNNSACRGLDDVPMLVPEINSHHVQVIETQKKRLGTKRGFIAVKPNCSIQSYVPPITALMQYEPTDILVCTYQAISGAGKTFDSFPEILDNIIPYISGEEEKSEKEPLKLWGDVQNGHIVNNSTIRISAQCLRVPVSDGHTAAVFVRFAKKPTQAQILQAWQDYTSPIDGLQLPSAPQPMLRYFDDPARPQAKLDRDEGKGMAITLGRLREDSQYDYKFVGLSHNTLRGAAGGGVLSAELLYRLGYLTCED